MNDLIEYKPLTEAITYSGDRYFKNCTPDEFFDIRSKKETIYFDISKRYVASAHIKEWLQADQEDIAIAWETMNMTSGQKRMIEASKKAFLEFWGGSKPLTNEMVRSFAELAKIGRIATF